MRYRGLNIREALDLTVDQAFEHFATRAAVHARAPHPAARRARLPASSASPRASSRAARRSGSRSRASWPSARAGPTLYLLDEPTVGPALRRRAAAARGARRPDRARRHRGRGRAQPRRDPELRLGRGPRARRRRRAAAGWWPRVRPRSIAACEASWTGRFLREAGAGPGGRHRPYRRRRGPPARPGRPARACPRRAPPRQSPARVERRAGAVGCCRRHDRHLPGAVRLDEYPLDAAAGGRDARAGRAVRRPPLLERMLSRPHARAGAQRRAPARHPRGLDRDARRALGLRAAGRAAWSPSIPSEGVVSPGAVGYDIGCGVRLLRSRLTRAELGPARRGARRRALPRGAVRRGLLGRGAPEAGRARPRAARGRRLGGRRAGWARASDLEHCEEGGVLAGADPGAVSDGRAGRAAATSSARWARATTSSRCRRSTRSTTRTRRRGARARARARSR